MANENARAIAVANAARLEEWMRKLASGRLKRAEVLSISGTTITCTDGTKAARLCGATLSVGDEIYLGNVSDNPRNPAWFVIGAVGGVSAGGIVTATDSATIDFAVSGDDLTGSVKSGSITSDMIANGTILTGDLAADTISRLAGKVNVVGGYSAELSTTNYTTGTEIAHWNTTGVAFGAGTWEAAVELDFTFRRTVQSGSTLVMFQVDGTTVATYTWVHTFTAADEKQRGKLVFVHSGLAGSTTHDFGVKFRGDTTAGTTRLSSVSCVAPFTRSA